MIFRKNKENFRVDDYRISVNYTPPKKFERQLAMLELTVDDLKYLYLFGDYVKQQIDVITDSFYNGIMQEVSLIDMINQHSSVNRLKETLKVHIAEMFGGQLNEVYFDKRK